MHNDFAESLLTRGLSPLPVCVLDNEQLTQFEDWHLEKLASPSEARAYLQLALEDYENDHNIEALLLAVRDVAKAMGSIEKLAEETNLNRQSAIAAL